MGTLTLYALGPGFGESQIISFPDGKMIVVDVCMRGGENLTLALLHALKRTSIDLLVVTHSDLDHIAGLTGLLSVFRPERVWRFPASTEVRLGTDAFLFERPGAPTGARE